MCHYRYTLIAELVSGHRSHFRWRAPRMNPVWRSPLVINNRGGSGGAMDLPRGLFLFLWFLTMRKRCPNWRQIPIWSAPWRRSARDKRNTADIQQMTQEITRQKNENGTANAIRWNSGNGLKQFNGVLTSARQDRHLSKPIRTMKTRYSHFRRLSFSNCNLCALCVPNHNSQPSWPMAPPKPLEIIVCFIQAYLFL